MELPPKNLGDDCTKRNPADKGGDNPENNDGGNSINSTWFFFTVLWAAIEAGAAWFFWWFSDPLEKHGYSRLSDCSLFLAGALILAVIAHGVWRTWKVTKPETANRVWWGYGSGVCVLVVVFLIICSNKPGVVNLVEPKLNSEYQLLPNDVISNILQALAEPTIHKKASAVLIYAVNPDESAFAFSEQLKKIFSQGGFVIVEGVPPQNIPEIPGISCFLYGSSAANTGLFHAIGIILNATKSHPRITFEPGVYSGHLTPNLAPGSLNFMGDQIQQISDPDFTNSVVVIMIRKK